MSSQIKAPKPLLLDGNVVENWIHFKRDLDNFFTASELDTKSDHIKIMLLETYIGDEGSKLLKSFEYVPGEEGDFAAVMSKLENHCRYHKNVIVERFKFLKTYQNEGQSFDEFLSLLRLRISNCKYGDQEKDILRDQVIVGLRDTALQERLLRKADLTLEDALKACLPDESVQDNTNATAAALKHTPKMQPMQSQNVTTSDKKMVKQIASRNDIDGTKPAEPYNCRKCGHRHMPRECWAFGKFCSFCNGPNHFVIGCKYAPKTPRFM